MRIDQLRAFNMVAEEHSFTRAANRLYTTQSNLTKQINALEHELGSRLLQRKPRGVELTVEGNAFLAFSQTAVEAVDNGTRAIQEIRESSLRHLDIGCCFLNYDVSTPLMVSEFLSERPEHSIDLHERDIDDAISDVEKNRLDGASISMVEPDELPGSLKYLELDTMGEKALVGKTHPWSLEKSLTRCDLEGISLLYPSRIPPSSISVVMRELEEDRWNCRISCVDLEGSMFKMIERGQGATFIPSKSVVTGHDLLEVPYMSNYSIHHLFVWRKGNDNPLLKEFVEFLYALKDENWFGSRAVSGSVEC